RCPASVGSTRLPERSRSFVPSRFSSERICRLTAGCVTPRRSAAWEKLLRSTTSQNAASWRVSISIHYDCEQLRSGEHGEHLLAVALQLRRSHAWDGGKLGQRARAAFGDLLQRRVVEDDVRRHLVGLRALQAPLLQRPEGRRKLVLDTLRASGRARLDAKLSEETARSARPRPREGAPAPR